MRACARLAAGLLLAAVLALPAGAAESLRCGNDFVRPGLPAAAVRERCGEPEELIVVTGDSEEQWIYRSRWSADPRILVFRESRLVRVRRLREHPS